MYHRLLACFASLLLAAPFAAAEMENIVLSPGSQLPFTHAKPIHRVAVGDPKVAAVAVTSPRSLLITGKQTGSTTLFVWENRQDSAPTYQARLVVTPLPDLAGDGSGPRVEPFGSRLKLSGAITSLDQHAAILQGAREDVKTIDATSSTFDSQVQIDIKVVEVSRSRLMNAGFFLGKNTSQTTAAISGPNNLSGVQSNTTNGDFTLLSESGFLPFLKSYNLVWGGAQKGLLGALSMLEEDGFAYTLAEPSLTAISGQMATFLAGGEIPIPMRTGTGSDSSINIIFKQFGVKLALTPTVLDRDRIFLKVSPEVSELDDTLGVQTGGVAVPGLRVRRTDTSVGLADGESFVLSGLVSRNTTNAVDKFPFLGDLPIIGAFFRSTNFNRADKELLMVVTAHVVRPFAKEQKLPTLPGEAYGGYDPTFSQLLFPDQGRFGPRTGFSE
ncbi:MAG: type II and III secretion system protein family protein [Rhodocyclaceae bacterium]|nr:type II and III secretion system protein family protein [Rhodocyclaceae bacterium]